MYRYIFGCYPDNKMTKFKHIKQIKDQSNLSKYDELKSLGVDEVYCVCVKASFAMHQLVKNLGINNVKMLPDADGGFTRSMGMLVKKGNNEMSWRYSAHVVNGEIKKGQNVCMSFEAIQV